MKMLDAFRAEGGKTVRSVVPWAVGGAGLLFPLIGALFMVIVKDPERAKTWGLIGAKARLSGLNADWPSYAGLLNQALAAGFLFLSALMMAWLFGRESSDRTMKLLLAVPVGRTRIVLAKFAVSLVWGVATLTIITLASLGLAGWTALPPVSFAALTAWAGVFWATGGLTWFLTSWVAFVASVGRGFLAPLAFALATVAVANLGVVLGWGTVIPWSIPGLMATSTVALPPGSLALALGTGTAGVAATVWFWKSADHPR